MRLAPAKVLDAELQALGLRDLGEVDVLGQCLRQAGHRDQHRVDLVVRPVLDAIEQAWAAERTLIRRQGALESRHPG